MKIGDRVRVKSLKEVLRIEGVEDYDDVGGPRIADPMLSYFGEEGLIHTTGGYYYVLFDGRGWVFKKEWLEKVTIVNPTYDELKPMFVKTGDEK